MEKASTACDQHYLKHTDTEGAFMDTYYHYSTPEPIRPDYAGKKRSPYADSDYVTPFDTAGMPDYGRTPVQPEPSHKKRRGGKIFLSVVLIIALVVSCCGATAVLVNEYWEEQLDLSNQVMNNKLSVLQEQLDAMNSGSIGGSPEASDDGLLTPGQVYGQNVAAVVAITSQGTTTNIYGQVSETASSGSGFLISQDGYVVTNYHVVQGANSLSVLTYDGDEYQAKLVGYDATNDICVLKIEAEAMPFVCLGSSDALAVGDRVAAIGNPLGELTSTLTVGYISAKDRMITTEGTAINMLQTDAAINSGNSGGPLFNMKGQVVGITTAKYSGTSTSGAVIEGIGFAIPMDDVAGMIRDLQEYGYITGAYLGVSVMNVAESAQVYGLPAGASVREVVPGYAAHRAGLQVQDIIVNLGGYDVESMSDLSRALRRFEAGDTTTITVYRFGREVNLSITLDEKPREP